MWHTSANCPQLALVLPRIVLLIETSLPPSSSVVAATTQVLAEINAGSRDGLQEGWVMTIADGSRFIGNLENHRS